MPSKQDAAARNEATEVFRQFAWHLAGSLASTKGGRAPAKGAGKSGARR